MRNSVEFFLKFYLAIREGAHFWDLREVKSLELGG